MPGCLRLWKKKGKRPNPPSLGASATSTSLTITLSGSMGANIAPITTYGCTVTGTGGGTQTNSTGVFTFTGLSVNSGYTVSAYAENAIGLSSISIITPSTIPDTPTLAQFTTTANSINVTVSSVGGASSYTCTMVGRGTQNNSTGSFSFTGLTAGTAYTVTAYATNSAGNSGTASAGYSTSIGVPSGPLNFTYASIDAGTTSGAPYYLPMYHMSWTWSAPASNGGSAITQYYLHPGPSGNGLTTYVSGSTFSYVYPGTSSDPTNPHMVIAASNSVGYGPNSQVS